MNENSSIPPITPRWRIPARLAPSHVFPPYRYIPGVGAHPIAHPDGHSFGREEVCLPLVDADWKSNEGYLFGFDLYNNGYWWEAHETWEGIWKATRTDDERVLLQALIQLAAAFLKAHCGRVEGVARFCTRIAGRLGPLLERRAAIAGIAIVDLAAIVRNLDEKKAAFCSVDYLADNFPAFGPGITSNDDVVRAEKP